MKKIVLTPLLLPLVLLCTQCTSPGWKHYQAGNEFEAVFDRVPFYAQSNPTPWTPPTRVLPQGERMALINWVPSEANVVLPDSMEGYVSTLEIAPVVDANGTAIKSRIGRRSGGPIWRPQPAPTPAFRAPAPPQVTQERPRFRLPWQRQQQEVSAPPKLSPPPQPAPRIQAPPTPAPPKINRPPVTKPKTQIERMFPKPQPKPVPTPTPEAAVPEFRPLP